MLGVVEKKGINVLTLLGFIIVARLSCPALSNIPGMSMGFVFVYGMVFCVLYLLSEKRLNQSEVMLLIVNLSYTFFVLLKIILSGDSIFGTDGFNAYVIFFLMIIYFWIKRQSNSVRANLLKLILVGCLFNYAYSIVVLYFDPSASRVAAASSALQTSPYDVLNAVGGFDAVYGGIFVVTLLLFIRHNLEKGKKKIWVSLISVLAIIFIFMASYATAIILLILMFFMFISKKNRFASFLFVFSIVIMLIFHEAVGEFLMRVSSSINYSETISTKIKELGYMIKTFKAAGTYAGDEGRIKNMIDSLTTFFKYPLFGGRGEIGAVIGGHSEFCDILGKYGLIGFSLLIMFFVFLYEEIRQNITMKENIKCLNIIYFIFIILTILNPALYTLIQLPIILMISLSESYINEGAHRTKIAGGA